MERSMSKLIHYYSNDHEIEKISDTMNEKTILHMKP